MARVAVAYVEVRPDLEGFGNALHTALTAVTLGEQKKLNAKMQAQQITHAGRMQAINDAMLKDELEQVIKNANAKAQESRIISEAETKALIQLERDAAAEIRRINRNALEQRLKDQNVVLNAQRNTRRAQDRLGGRFAAEDFAEAWGRTLSDELEKITVSQARDFERSMVDRFGAVGGSVARAFVNDFNRDVDRALQRQADRTAAGWLRRMSRGLGKGSFGRVFLKLGLTAVAGLMESVSRVTTRALTAMLTGIEKLLAQFGVAGEGVQKFFATAIQMAGQVGNVVGVLVALAAIASLVGVVMAAVNLALGATLAIIIPLIGAVTALVAEFVALGAAAVGGVGLLPGLFGAAAAAFAPLLLVGEKFQDLFEDTAERTGPLFVALERLKNAIFAIMATGFVQQVLRFANTVLPQLLGGIEAVSAAWGRLLTGLVQLASTQSAVAAFNLLLSSGAQLVDFLASMIGTVGPALLTMATAALPAITSILNSVKGMAQVFADWVASMAASGGLTAFFNSLAVIFGQLSQLFTPLATLMSAWIVNLLPPVSQFVGLLQQMLEHWVALATSPAGADMIQKFFFAMNQIMAALVPVIDQVVTGFLQFGPTLANLVVAAVPALQQLISMIMNLVQAVGPSVMVFLQQFATMLGDPAVQASITQLGMAIGTLLESLIMSAPAFQSIIQWVAYAIEIFAPFIDIIMALVAVLAPMSAQLAGFLVPVLETLLRIMQPILDAFHGVGAELAANTIPAVEKVTGAIEWLVNALDVGLRFIGRWLTDLPLLGGMFEGIGTGLTKLGNMFGLTGDKAVDSSKRTVGALNTAANTGAWGVLNNNAQLAGEYMVNMGNNAIRGASAYVSALAAMGAAAYARKNEADIQQFEKQVTRAYTLPTANMYVSATKVGGGVGRAAGSAFMNAYNSEISTKAGEAAKKGRNTAAGFISNFVGELSKLSSFTIIKGRTAYDSGREIARYIARGITSGSKNIDKVARYIQKNFGGKLTEAVSKNKEFWRIQGQITKALPDFAAKMKKFTSGEQLDKYLAARQDYYEDLLDQIKGFKANAISALTQGADLVNYFGFIPTPAEVKARLDAQLASINDFTSGLAALQAKGLSKELAAAWLQAGYDSAGNLVEGLQGATREEIAAINAQYKTIGDTAAKAADDQAAKYFGVGQSTVEGYIKGIQSMRTIAGKEMTALIDYVYKAVKAKLKIKSPSKMYFGTGVDTVAGYVGGVASMQNAAVTTVTKLYDAVTGVTPATLKPGAVKPGFAGVGALNIPPQPAPVVNVRVFVGDQEIKDIVRVETERADERYARALYAGRRGV